MKDQRELTRLHNAWQDSLGVIAILVLLFFAALMIAADKMGLTRVAKPFGFED